MGSHFLLGSPALQADTSPCEPIGKPIKLIETCDQLPKATHIMAPLHTRMLTQVAEQTF